MRSRSRRAESSGGYSCGVVTPSRRPVLARAFSLYRECGNNRFTSLLHSVQHARLCGWRHCGIVRERGKPRRLNACSRTPVQQCVKAAIPIGRAPGGRSESAHVEPVSRDGIGTRAHVETAPGSAHMRCAASQLLVAARKLSTS